MTDKIMEQMLFNQRKKFNETYADRLTRTETPPDIFEVRDIVYSGVATPWAHNMDVCRPKAQTDNLPVVLNIHGGGGIMGSKEFSRDFCLRLCRKGFVVFNIKYWLLPESTVYIQIEDILKAMKKIRTMLPLYGGDESHIYMSGDSYGAFLAVYAVAMQKSPSLANAFFLNEWCIPILPIHAMGLVSGMFYTTRYDAVGNFLSRPMYRKSRRKNESRAYTNPEHPEVVGNLPPCILITSHADKLRRYTLDFASAMKKNGVPCQVMDFPANKKLVHAFCVFDPSLPETEDVISAIADYLRRF